MNTETKELVARRAENGDAVRLAEISLCGWRWAYRGIVPDQELFRERSIDKAIEFFRRLIGGDEDITLAEDEGGIVHAFAIHGPLREPVIDGAWELRAFYADPFLSRRGAGSLLVSRVAEHARGKGCTQLCAWALEANTIGQSFYRKAGFVANGHTKIIEKWDATEILLTMPLD